ncbi:MAG: hypothetical protein R3E76_09305 [Planctomycetota bacterium]
MPISLLASTSSSGVFIPLARGGPPPEFFAMMGVFAVIYLVIIAAFATGGYFIAKKYQMAPWIGLLLGGFLGWIGLLIVFLMGHSQEQNRKREEEARRYAEWWHANYGNQPQPQVSQTPYGWPGQNPPPAPPPPYA